MALVISTLFGPGANLPSPEYPQGSHKDSTSPGADDGSPNVAAVYKDIYGFLQKLILESGITPSGDPDTVLASDYWDALNAILGTGLWPQNNFFHAVDQKTQNTPGGTITDTIDNIRDLTIVKTNTITGASLDSGTGQVTLPAGRFYIEAACPAYGVNEHQSRLYNETDAGDEIVGESSYSDITNPSTTKSAISDEIVLASPKALSLRTVSAITQLNNGGGFPGNFNIEIYSSIKIWEIK